MKLHYSRDKLKDILEQLHDRDKKEEKTTDTGDGE